MITHVDYTNNSSQMSPEKNNLQSRSKIQCCGRNTCQNFHQTQSWSGSTPPLLLLSACLLQSRLHQRPPENKYRVYTVKNCLIIIHITSCQLLIFLFVCFEHFGHNFIPFLPICLMVLIILLDCFACMLLYCGYVLNFWKFVSIT